MSQPLHMDDANNIPLADRVKLKALFGLDVSSDGVIIGLTDHPEFAFFVAMHTTGQLTARLRISSAETARALRNIADLIEADGESQ